MNFVKCLHSRDVSSSCDFRLWLLFIYFSKKKFINFKKNSRTFFFLYYIRVCDASHCWKRFFRSNLTINFFFISFHMLCIFFVINCNAKFLLIYVFEHLFKFLIIDYIVQERCANVLKLLILIFCLTYLITQWVWTFSSSIFFLTFVILL